MLIRLGPSGFERLLGILVSRQHLYAKGGEKRWERLYSATETDAPLRRRQISSLVQHLRYKHKLPLLSMESRLFFYLLAPVSELVKSKMVLMAK